VVLEILDSVGMNPKARGVKSDKKPSDLLRSSTRRTVKTEHGKVLFSKTCSGPAYDMAASFRRKQALETAEYIAMEASFGNGFVERLEHRQQYKLNGLRQFVLMPRVDALRYRILRVLRHPGADSDRCACARRHD
jgi:hypothetical protein